MTCNCDNDGSNEYIIELNQQGAPGVRGEKGEQGYSPTVSYISDGSGLVINIVNEQDTISTPTIPLKSYVDTLSDTKMNTDGSNAASSVKFNNITFSYVGATQQTIRTISDQELLIAGQGLYLQGHASQAQGYPNAITIAPRGTSISIGNTNRHSVVVDNDGAFYDGNEIATVNQIPSITGKLNTDGSNATNTFTVNGIELAGDYVYINGVSSGGISVTQSNSDIFAKLQVDSSIAQLRMPGLYLNSGATGNISLNTTRDIVINGSNTSDKIYYHGTSADDEIATLGDITGTSYVAGDNITINGDTISATDTTYSNFIGATTLTGGSAGLVPAPTTSDAGKYLRGNGTWSGISGSSIINPINLITESNDMFWMGIATNATPHKIYGGCQNSNGVQYLKYIYDSSNPISLTDDPLGHGTSKIELNYNTNTMGLDSSNNLTVKEMTGCDSITGGTSGLVPAPSAGDEDKFLKANGTWDTVGGGVSEVFIAEYGTTTFSEVLTAYNADKVIFCYDDNNNTYAPITNYTGTDFYFSTGLVNNISASYTLDDNDTWDGGDITLATVATSGAYSDLIGTPTIPTVNNPTITFTQGGVTKGTITLNQSSDATIALDAGGGGGAEIDDTTSSTTTVYSSQKTQNLIDALTARIMALEANINGGNA